MLGLGSINVKSIAALLKNIVSSSNSNYEYSSNVNTFMATYILFAGKNSVCIEKNNSLSDIH